jgi:hypothetical protein
MRSSFETTQRLLDLHRGALQRRYSDVDLDSILRALRRGGVAEELEATDNRGAEERERRTLRYWRMASSLPRSLTGRRRGSGTSGCAQPAIRCTTITTSVKGALMVPARSA